MMNLTNLIKTAARQAVDASNPTHIMFGEVTSVNPLEVNVDQRFNLTADFLIVPESLTRYEVDLSHSHSYSGGTTGDGLTTPVVIREGLQVGDKLILIRVQGGQKYVIFDKVGEP
jgi:hypothetical protein